MPSEPAPSTANPFTRSIEAQHFPVTSPLHNRSRGAGSMAGLGSKKLYPKRLRQNTSSVSVSRSWQAGAGGRCRRNKIFSTRSSQIVTCSAHLSLSQPPMACKVMDLCKESANAPDNEDARTWCQSLFNARLSDRSSTVHCLSANQASPKQAACPAEAAEVTAQSNQGCSHPPRPEKDGPAAQGR